MKINPKETLKNYDGTVIEDGEKPVELKVILINALAYEDAEMKSTAEEKMRAYELSLLLMNKETVDLKSEDIVFIKLRLAKLYPVLIYGQTIKLLEQ